MARSVLLASAVALVFAFVAVGSGCGLNPEVRTEDSPNSALIYGYFDMSESPNTLRSVFLTQNEKQGIAYRQSRMRTYADGLYFMENLPPMTYHIPFFMAGNVQHVLSSSEKDLFDVPPGAMVFLGSFKYHDPGKGGILTEKKFEMRPADKPSEAEVLKLLLERIESPRWKERIRKRLRSLSR